MFCFVGCGKEEVLEPEPTPVPTPMVDEIVVKDSEGKDIVDITTLTKDEFVALTWEQIRDFTETRLPNYKEIYKIDEDRVMEEADWLYLKELMFWQLFDQVYADYVRVGDVYNDVEIEIDEFGADWIYVTPTKEYLNSLTQSEFGIYLNNFYAFHEMTIMEKDEETGTEKAFDFEPLMVSFSEEEFQTVREQFILEMEELIHFGEASNNN